jgi:hypothetical protein
MELGKTALPLILALATWGCADVPPAYDAGPLQPADTEDGECNPAVQQNWGQTCTQYDNTCPANTVCQTVKDLGSAQGLCATECCGPEDHDHCPDVAPGLEKCVIEDTYYGRWYCAVVCHDGSDCTGGQSCQYANSVDRICYPPQ